MTQTNKDTLLQLIINEVFGQFEGEKEEMFDLLDEFFHQWIWKENKTGFIDQHLSRGVMLYFFFNRVIRTMEISFEKEIE